MKTNIMAILLTTMLAASDCAHAQNIREESGAGSAPAGEALPKVYFFREISSENLVRIYEALGREARGKVAVKLSTGEPGGHGKPVELPHPHREAQRPD